MTDKELIKQEIERLKHTDIAYDRSRFMLLLQIEDFVDSLPEEHASEDLEEELDRRFGKTNNYSISDFAKLYSRKDFKNGAEWQKQKDQETIELAEDHAMLAGMNRMKEEMMENAVYGYVSLCHDYPHRRSLVAIADGLVKFEYAEKVKIIICKTEQ